MLGATLVAGCATVSAPPVGPGAPSPGPWLLPAAEAMAKRIIANAPLAVKYTMEAIERGIEMPQEEGLFLEATLFGLVCATEDKREGTTAFLEKRPPQFRGK